REPASRRAHGLQTGAGGESHVYGDGVPMGDRDRRGVGKRTHVVMPAIAGLTNDRGVDDTADLDGRAAKHEGGVGGFRGIAEGAAGDLARTSITENDCAASGGRRSGRGS